MEIGSNIRPSEIQALLIYSVVKEYNNIIDTANNGNYDCLDPYNI